MISFKECCAFFKPNHQVVYEEERKAVSEVTGKLKEASGRGLLEQFLQTSAPIYKLQSNNVSINTEKDLADFISNWIRNSWEDKQKPVRVRVFKESLYDRLHDFLGTKQESEQVAPTRILKVDQDAGYVMKRSSPRKLLHGEKVKRDLVEVSEQEFAFYQDIQERREALERISQGSPNFPQVKLLLTLDTPNRDPATIGSKSYAILMENFGPDLFELGCKSSIMSIEDQLINILTVLEALVFIHDAGYVHLDIKPENITKKGIIDFGFAQKILQGRLRTTSGTRRYISPEILLLNLCDQRTDVWSLGIAVYTIFVREYLFNIDSDFRNYPGSVINHLALLRPRLSKTPGTLLGHCSKGIIDAYFTQDSGTKVLRLKRSFRHADVSFDPKKSKDPFTIKPNTPESDINHLKSLGIYPKDGKWFSISEEKGEASETLISDERILLLLKRWRKVEENRLAPFEKRIEQVALQRSLKLSLLEKEKYKYFSRLLIDFLHMALEPDCSKRPTARELLKTELVIAAKKIRVRREMERDSSDISRRAAARRVGRRLFV